MKFFVSITIGLLSASSVMADSMLEQDINAGLSRLIPGVQVDSVEETPIPSLYQVILGPDIIYMTRDANYLIKGEILDIAERRNLTDDVRARSRMELIDSIDKNEYIEFAAEKEKDAIYVFTDIDCGYCRKLHQDVPELNELGVSVRYLAYPRAGIGSATAREMGSVWCADDKQAALTAAKNRDAIEEKICDDPVAKQYALGKKMGVRGTPAIYFADGRSLPGYMPPEEIVKQLH